MWLILAALLGIQPADAGNRSGQVSVGAGPGLLMNAPWASRNARSAVDPGFRGTAWMRFHHDHPNTGFELAYDYFDHGKMPFRAHGPSLAFFWRFLERETFHPIWSFAGGYGFTDGFFGGPKRDMAFFKLRVGADIEMNSRMDLGVYLDHISFFKDRRTEENVHSLAPTVALIFYFGDHTPPPSPEAAKKAETAKTEKPKSESDSDGDGVLDSKDRCAGTPKGEKVNELGCIVKPQAAAAKKKALPQKPKKPRKAGSKR